MRPPDPAALGLIANAQPPSVDVARRVGFSLDALQHYDPARARDELLEAIAEAPGYAPAYMYLSQAWSGLGYRDKALAAAEQAAQHATNLPVEQQLQVEAVRASARAEWPKAVEAWKKLSLVNPRDLEYRLQIIDSRSQREPRPTRRRVCEKLDNYLAPGKTRGWNLRLHDSRWP
jgi:tetratricopeptide (TPR) repeat protein